MAWFEYIGGYSEVTVGGVGIVKKGVPFEVKDSSIVKKLENLVSFKKIKKIKQATRVKSFSKLPLQKVSKKSKVVKDGNV